METSCLIEDFTNYESVRHFMRSFHFIGYIEKTENSVIIRALELGSKKEVAIRFLKSKGKPINKETLISLLAHHKSIFRIYDYLSLGNVNAYIFEYFKGNSLSMLLKEVKKISIYQLGKVFRQILDTVNYLHKHGIVGNIIEPSNILVDEKFTIKINKLDNAYFCDSKEFSDSYKTDILAIGNTLYAMLLAHKGIGEHNPRLEVIADCISNYRELGVTLKRILVDNSDVSLDDIYRINCIKKPNGLKMGSVRVLDLLILDQLKNFGVEIGNIRNLVNDDCTKEANMYYLCGKRIDRDTAVLTEEIKCEGDRSVMSYVLYSRIKRRQDLIQRKHELMKATMKIKLSFPQCFGCFHEYSKKIVVEILFFVESINILRILKELYFSVYERKDIFYIKNDELLVVMELVVYKKNNVFLCSDSGVYGWVEFKKTHGRDSNFVKSVVSIIDRLKISDKYPLI